jgi:hypothetical protein
VKKYRGTETPLGDNTRDSVRCSCSISRRKTATSRLVTSVPPCFTFTSRVSRRRRNRRRPVSGSTGLLPSMSASQLCNRPLRVLHARHYIIQHVREGHPEQHAVSACDRRGLGRACQLLS